MAGLDADCDEDMPDDRLGGRKIKGRGGEEEAGRAANLAARREAAKAARRAALEASKKKWQKLDEELAELAARRAVLRAALEVPEKRYQKLDEELAQKAEEQRREVESSEAAEDSLRNLFIIEHLSRPMFAAHPGPQAAEQIATLPKEVLPSPAGHSDKVPIAEEQSTSPPLELRPVDAAHPDQQAQVAGAGEHRPSGQDVAPTNGFSRPETAAELAPRNLEHTPARYHEERRVVEAASVVRAVGGDLVRRRPTPSPEASALLEIFRGGRVESEEAKSALLKLHPETVRVVLTAALIHLHNSGLDIYHRRGRKQGSSSGADI